MSDRQTVRVGCSYCRHEFEVNAEAVSSSGVACWVVSCAQYVICPECRQEYYAGRLLIRPSEEAGAQTEAEFGTEDAGVASSAAG